MIEKDKDMKNIVQVFGSGRTGTTMTHLMLGNASDAFSCGEIYSFFRPWRSHHYKPECACKRGYSECFWRKLDNIHPRGFHKKLTEEAGGQWVIDESKNLRWIVDSQQWAQKNNMNIFNILMYKKPINLMHSFWKRGRPLNQVTKVYINYYECFLKLNIPFVSINLEELTNNPKEQLMRICDVIGMEYFEGKERFWEKQHCHLFGSLGVRKQMEKGDMSIRPEPEFPEEFKSLAQPELEKFERDARMKEIQDKLIERNVNNVSNYDGTPHPVENRVLPAWYYKDWLRSLFRKHFPQRWDYSQ